MKRLAGARHPPGADAALRGRDAADRAGLLRRLARRLLPHRGHRARRDRRRGARLARLLRQRRSRGHRRARAREARRVGRRVGVADRRRRRSLGRAVAGVADRDPRRAHRRHTAVGPRRRRRARPRGRAADGGALIVVIEPSMGFGTGHHESTRLCLAALQRTPLAGRSVSTSARAPGSWPSPRRGSAPRTRVGIDDDADALDSATANVALTRSPPVASRCAAATCSPRRCPSPTSCSATSPARCSAGAAATLSTAVAPRRRPDRQRLHRGRAAGHRARLRAADVANAESEHGWLALTFSAPA